MNIIPALELTGWRATETYCRDNRFVVKYEFCCAARFECEQCGSPMQRRGSRMLTIRDTPYNEIDVVLEIDSPVVWCPQCRKFA